MAQANWYERYQASYIATLRIQLPDRPGALAEVLNLISAQATHVGNIDLVGVSADKKVRDIQLFLKDASDLAHTLSLLKALPGVEVSAVSDDVMEIHRHGTIETRARVPLDTLMDLRMVYTPGVASVCEHIAKEPAGAWDYTALGRKIAIVTNGTAVLGLGDIGPLASLPVMEGKAAILSRFVNVSAEPILVDSRDPATVIATVERIATGYGAIQLEDIAAPECFEIEAELSRRLNKPVFHDDQHGTATVVLAGLIRALKRCERRPEECRAAILGAGAAGSAIARFLTKFGVKDIVVCDSKGALHPGRSDLNPAKQAIAAETNAAQVAGPLSEVMRGRNLFIGVSKPGVVSEDMVRSMDAPIVFALANPVSEIPVDAALAAGALVAADGRGMNNALAYPGIFRGALDARAQRITPDMMLAAAKALAAAATGDDLLPDMLDLSVHERVSAAVRDAAEKP